MKAVFISYNQTLTERVLYMLEKLEIRGYTRWKDVSGKGSIDGEPREGTHTWPEKNGALLSVIEDEKVPLVLKYVEKMDDINRENGIRAFVWDITGKY